MLLTDRDRELLVVLTRRLRFMTGVQIARAFWSASSSRSARRRLDDLARHGLLESHTAMAHPELDLGAPLYSWRPGEAAPDVEALAYRLSSRWGQALRPTTLLCASKKAARLFGGGGGELRRPLQVTHDLHMATVYVELLARDPEAAKRWMGEDWLPRAAPGAKHPDAVIVDDRGRPELVIEFGGAYDGRRVRKLHEHCAAKALRYELW